MANPRIHFLGAAGTVTGSRFLIEGARSKVLIDCGMYQGVKELRQKNWEAFPISPATIDAVLLTHAHIDHCGYLPKLVREGFAGPVYATANTARLAAVVLRDAAKLQTEDANYAKKKGYSKHKDPLPLYTFEDAELALMRIKPVDFHTTLEVAPGISVIFRRSGHILGSSFVEVLVDNKRVVFSGDLGRPAHPILQSPDSLPSGKIDAIICESTYGDRQHPVASSTMESVLNKTFQRGGSVLIPAFAVDRTEIILMNIKKLMEEGKIRPVPVFVDSPMALTTLDIYRGAIKAGSGDIRSDFPKVGDPFDFGTLVQSRTVEESKSINNPDQPCIIISASGMATGGRVVHHLELMLPNPKNTVLLVGYQSVGTRGHSLLMGAKELKMFGKYVPVKAEIEQIEEYSVHADSKELMHWLKAVDVAPTCLYLVHGEEKSSELFAEVIQKELGWNVVVPRTQSAFPL